MLVLGLFIPFFGTLLGSFMVFFMGNSFKGKIEKILLGFAAGVMVAASVWSLLIPSIDMAVGINWLPATIGFIFGIVFLVIIHNYIIKYFNGKMEKVVTMVWAVTLHNIPEGMAVGVALAGAISNNSSVTMMGALSLAIGIGIQNFPEGAIISMPLKERGVSKFKSFLYGVLSGVVEPIGALVTLFITKAITFILPYLLSFAAGAMIYVVVDELIPESQEGEYSFYGIIGFSGGFLLMMILDVVFG